jgi:beta-glucosidase
VTRIVRMIVRAGFLDRAQKIDSIPLDDPESSRTALQIAREGIVLLKNEKNVLPLDAGKIKSIAVLGPNAGPEVPVGGGSSYTTPFHAVGVIEGIKQRVGPGVKVIEVPDPMPRAAAMATTTKFEHKDDSGAMKPGLLAQFYADRRNTATVALSRVDEKIDFNWATDKPKGLPDRGFFVVWSGLIRPEKSGRYLFAAETAGGVRVMLDDKPVVQQWRGRQGVTSTRSSNWKPGRPMT